MGGTAQVIQPREECIDYHNRKYKVFLKQLADQREYRKIMEIGK